MKRGGGGGRSEMIGGGTLMVLIRSWGDVDCPELGPDTEDDFLGPSESDCCKRKDEREGIAAGRGGANLGSHFLNTDKISCLNIKFCITNSLIN